VQQPDGAAGTGAPPRPGRAGSGPAAPAPRSQPPRFEPGRADPVAFDRAATAALVARCAPVIEPLLARLSERRFAFYEMHALYADALDAELVYRQCAPAAGYGLALAAAPDGQPGLAPAELTDYLEAFALCQTMVLNHLDRHLDLSSSYAAKDTPLLLSDVRAAASFAVAALYEGMRAIPPTAAGAAALREMAAVSVTVIQSRYSGYATRFDPAMLAHPEGVLADYADPVQSRHLGSGFYSSGVLGLHAFAGLDVPPALAEILAGMGTLRQRVDELADIHEDTVTGMVTYPVAALLLTPAAAKARPLIEAAWERCRRLTGAERDDAGSAARAVREDRKLRAATADLLDLLADSGVLEACYAEADELWQYLSARIPDDLGDVGGRALFPVLDLKRAFLERLADQGWQDVAPPHTFAGVRAAVLACGSGFDVP
jgi:hypothetical protein